MHTRDCQACAPNPERTDPETAITGREIAIMATEAAITGQEIAIMATEMRVIGVQMEGETKALGARTG